MSTFAQLARRPLAQSPATRKEPAPVKRGRGTNGGATFDNAQRGRFREAGDMSGSPGDPLLVQAKLCVGSVEDPLEREADRIAETVMTSGATPVEASGSSRSPSSASGEGSCDCIRRKPLKVPAGGLSQQAADGSGLVVPSNFAGTLLDRIAHGGQRLAPQVLRSMEPRFSADFSRVRVHADSESSDLARQLRARAFTWREHIFFARGEFATDVPRGQRLLAHELAHVVQQSERATEVIRRAPQEDVQESGPRDAARAAAYSLIFHGSAAGPALPTEALRSLDSSELSGVDPVRTAANLFDYLQNESKPGEVIVSALDLLSADPTRVVDVATRVMSGFTDDILKNLLTDAWGPIAVERLVQVVEQAGAPHVLSRSLANFGRLDPTGSSQSSIRSNKKTTDTQRHCMTCVEHNIKSMFGGPVEKFMRNDAFAEAKQDNSGTRLSDYAGSLMKMGKAREVVEAKFSHGECNKNIVFDPVRARLAEDDPWTFPRLGDVPVYKPDPLRAIEEAIKYGADGLYPFIASVEQHHAVTLIAEKAGGKVEVYWNDPGAIKQNVAAQQNALGILQTRESLARKIWDNATVEHSEAEELYAGWRAREIKKWTLAKEKAEKQGKEHSEADPRASLAAKFDPRNSEHVELVKSLRCWTHGIRIWQLLPVEG